jgi:acyl-CoA thioester hydrolase
MNSQSPDANTEPHLPGFPVAIRLPVLWGDQDAFGHVNNTVFLRWFESARIEYIRRVTRVDAPSPDNAGLILASIQCDFKLPVNFPDLVVIGARVARIGNSSMRMEHAVWSEAQQALVAEGHSTVVVFDYTAGRSRPVPDDVRTAIAALEGDPALASR